MAPNQGDVDQLLQTILVPTFPPNRSQWRKLDIAMQFIHRSKMSLKRKREENLHNDNTAAIVDSDDERKDSIRPNKRKITIVENLERGNVLRMSPKKQKGWSKVKKTMLKIL